MRTSFVSRLLRPRALVPLLTVVIVAVALVALLTTAEHGRRHQRANLSLARAAVASHGHCGSSAPSPGLTRTLDAALRTARSRTGTPAATAAVVVCGRVVWAGASGVLVLGSRRPVTNGSLFILNSAVKTVVATMVMREVEDGQLSLDTRLGRFFPSLPNAGRITIRDLLDMRSGLPDYLYTPRVEWMINHRPRHHWTVDQVLTALGGGLGTPKFAPGREFQYSDTNYIALGATVERVTHRSIQSDFERLIAAPAAITDATFIPSAAARAQMAHPYVLRDGSPVSQWIPGFGLPTVLWGPVFTDGGLAITSTGLARFGNALIGDRLVDATEVRQMTRIGPGNYGFGIRGRSFGGRFWVGHRGYYDGFEAEGWSDPTRQLTIAAETDLQKSADSEPTSTIVWTAVTQAYDRYTAR